MAVKYRIEYDDDSGVTTRIDISDTSFAGSVTVLTAASDPLIIHMSNAEDTLTPVQGGGATISVLGKDSDDLRSLYTSDPHKYRVEIFKGGLSSDSIIFLGWINTGVYTEAYNEADNYPLTFTANDGLNALSRFKYLNAGDKFTGEDEVMDVILRCIAKTGLEYHQLRVSTGLYFSGYTIASNDTILNKLDVINANYYDEQSVPKSFKEVLEMILRALGLVMFIEGAEVYIIDPLDQWNSSITLKNFNLSTGAYIDTDSSVDHVYDIGTDCSWYQTGAQLDYMDGFSRLPLTYSGYADDNIFGLTNWSDTNYHSSEGTWNLVSPGASRGDDWYQNTTWGGIDGWTPLNGAYWAASRYDGRDEYHMRFDRTVVSGVGSLVDILQYTGTSGVLRGATDSQLAIQFGMHVQTADDGYYNPQKDKDVFYGILGFYCELKVGDKYFDGFTSTWSTTQAYCWLSYKGFGDTLNDKWFEFKTFIPLPSDVSGEVQLTFIDRVQLGSVKWYILDSPDIRNLRVKDMSISVVDGQGYVQNFDLSVDCDLDNLWNSDAPTLELEHGDSSFGVASHRAGFIDKITDEWATNFRVSGMAVYKNLFEVLLKRYSSQYRESRLMLHGKIEAPSIYGSGGFGKLSQLTDSANLSGKKLILLSGQYHDRDRFIEGDWIELLEDNITFV